jgi:putative spermidine/putrescine transport system substrate-binding protein
MGISGDLNNDGIVNSSDVVFLASYVAKIPEFIEKYNELNPIVVVASWGGFHTEVQKLALGDPTAKKLGIGINWVTYSGGLSQIRDQKVNGDIKWDIMDVYENDTNIGCDESIFNEFDLDQDFPPAPDGTPASKDFFTEMPNKCAVGNILYSWNYAYNTDVLKGNNTPRTIKDFFNTKKFPGKRAIYVGAISNLEIALLAMDYSEGRGERGKNIYNLLKKEKFRKEAIKKIEKLANDPKGGIIFWSSGSQPPELLTSGEVVMSTGWNSRFFKAAVDDGLPIKQVWDCQGIDTEYFAQVKGGPNDKNGLAKESLAMMTNTEILAQLSKYIAYSPFRKSSIKYIAEQEKKNGPWYKDGKTFMIPNLSISPQNLKKYFLVDPEFWRDYGSDINIEWEEMKNSI